MKSYSFSKVSARGYLTEADYNNKYIFTDDLKQIINVSGRPLEKPLSFFRERDLIARNMPLTDKDGDMGFDTLLKAVRYLLAWDRRDKRSIVCCAFGVNRSRTVIEAFHYAKLGFHFEDEYEGFTNHLIYNCTMGFLPPLEKVERELKRLGNEYDPSSKEKLNEMKSSVSDICYNEYASQLERFICDIKSLDIADDKYEDLSKLMSSFKEVKIKDGYVLDGFQAGLPHFDSSMYLHARKKEATEFVPFDWDDFHMQWFSLSLDKNEEESKKLEASVCRYFSNFDDAKFIRKSLCYWHAEKFVRPIWQDITVPFNEQGIWEAVLLFIAPRLMSGYWHWIYCRITPVTSNAVLISKAHSVDDYMEYADSVLRYPTVEITSEDTAIVRFMSWGRYGLGLWELSVVKDGDSVRIEKPKDVPKNLIYYEPKFMV